MACGPGASTDAGPGACGGRGPSRWGRRRPPGDLAPHAFGVPPILGGGRSPRAALAALALPWATLHRTFGANTEAHGVPLMNGRPWSGSDSRYPVNTDAHGVPLMNGWRPCPTAGQTTL